MDLLLRWLLEGARFGEFITREKSWPKYPPGVPRVAGLLAERKGQPVMPGYFDNIRGFGYRGMEVKEGTYSPYKGRKGVLVPPQDRIGICVHQTSVKFGVSKKRIAVWSRRLRDLQINEEDRMLLGIASAAMSKIERDAAARRMALHERFWKVPYHVVSLSNGDILLNNDLPWYTYHGGKANREMLGFCVEGLYPALKKNRRKRHTDFDDFMIETGQKGLRLEILKARESGASVRLIQPHRCYSRKRRGDPGEEIWREIVLPVAQDLSIDFDYELAVGGGRPIPREWDANSRYNWRGKLAPPSDL